MKGTKSTKKNSKNKNMLLKGFFSGSEIALVNADKFKLHHKANQGHRGAKLVLKLFRTPDVLLGTTLVGTNISTIILTTLGTMLMIRSFGELGDLYAVNVFPQMEVWWNTYPDHIGHQSSDGCTRCHARRLRMEDREMISEDCDICHTVLAEEEETPSILDLLNQ